METPEDLFLVADVDQQQCHDIVHPLHVSYLSVEVGVRHQHVEKFVVAAEQVL